MIVSKWGRMHYCENNKLHLPVWEKNIGIISLERNNFVIWKKINLCSATFECQLPTSEPRQTNFPLSDLTLFHLSQWGLKTS